MNTITHDAQTNQLGRLLTIKEVAQTLGVSTRTVYRLISDGILPQPLRIRGCSRIPATAVQNYLDELEHSPF